ncbi:RNA 2'-phosphotransferase [Vibrio sp. M250220]|uniref:RNA 2'-phosphotransferase n=1 Tax=Vibrio sp. M250220 TaxID=3020894 RepID=UPI002F3E8847
MNTSKELNQLSKFLSYVLRHKPEAIGLSLDPNGWADIDDLIAKANSSGEVNSLDKQIINEIVTTSDKKRFAISENGQCIRANQGHSVNVDVELKKAIPPRYLYHGTATRFLDSILNEGLKSKQRLHVHLSSDIETATAVGKRYGHPIILKIKALEMYQQGHEFYISKNDVWLTEKVSSEFIIS